MDNNTKPDIIQEDICERFECNKKFEIEWAKVVRKYRMEILK
jgi:hypothetical protein